jgi:hypothetical protein
MLLHITLKTALLTQGGFSYHCSGVRKWKSAAADVTIRHARIELLWYTITTTRYRTFSDAKVSNHE